MDPRVPPRHKPRRCHKRKPMRRTERKVQVVVSTAVVSDDLYKRQPSLQAAEPTKHPPRMRVPGVGMNVPGFVRSVVGLRFFRRMNKTLAASDVNVIRPVPSKVQPRQAVHRDGAQKKTQLRQAIPTERRRAKALRATELHLSALYGRLGLLVPDDKDAARRPRPQAPTTNCGTRLATTTDLRAAKSLRSAAEAALASLAPPRAVPAPARRCHARETFPPSDHRSKAGQAAVTHCGLARSVHAAHVAASTAPARAKSGRKTALVPRAALFPR